MKNTSLSLRLTTGSTTDNTDGTHESTVLHAEPSSAVASAQLSVLFPKNADGTGGLEPGVYSLSLSRISGLPSTEPAPGAGVPLTGTEPLSLGTEQAIPAPAERRAR